jgi:hypothetical protein
MSNVSSDNLLNYSNDETHHEILDTEIKNYTLSSKKIIQCVKLTTHLHLVTRSRMREAIPPLPQYFFRAWCLVKHRDNFTFYLFIYFKKEL